MIFSNPGRFPGQAAPFRIAMINGKHVTVVLPAYNAERTLQKTYDEVPKDIVDKIILTDDASHDATVALARKLGIETFVHPKNMGYGANQKTCYREALRHGTDIIVMLHPDYQYTPKLITAMASMISEGVFDAVIASRILGNQAISGGMPVYKYIANRVLTGVENLIIGEKLSEFHTGYRAFHSKVFETIPILENSDDFAFDNQMLLQILYFGFKVGEVSCPALYFDDASSISFRRSVTYGLAVLKTACQYYSSKKGWSQPAIFNPDGKKLAD